MFPNSKRYSKQFRGLKTGVGDLFRHVRVSKVFTEMTAMVRPAGDPGWQSSWRPGTAGVPAAPLQLRTPEVASGSCSLNTSIPSCHNPKFITCTTAQTHTSFQGPRCRHGAVNLCSRSTCSEELQTGIEIAQTLNLGWV